MLIGLAGVAGLAGACGSNRADTRVAFGPAEDTAPAADIRTEPNEGNPTVTNDDTIHPTTPDNTTFPRTERLTYGEAPQQFGDLMLSVRDPAPLVVLIHGGFWRNPYGLDLMEPLAADLVDRGYAVWNIEYRRLGDDGGGWPGTLTDVAAAIDLLVTIDRPLDLDRVGFVGHSAGGHLALWAAGRGDLPPGVPGSSPTVVPAVAVGQGAVVDLIGAATARLGNGAAEELIGDAPAVEPDRYRWASPSLGAGPTMVSVVGSADTIVPPQFSVDAPPSGDITVIEVDGADHFDLIDPGHQAWLTVVDQLDATIGTPLP